MISSEIQKKLEELENQIKTAYCRNSIIDDVCIPVKVALNYEYGKFTKFANRLLIERERITNPSNYLILGEIGTSVARGEERHIIDTLSKSASRNIVKEISYEEITKGVDIIMSRGFTPNHIFMPIDYLQNVIKWRANKPISKPFSDFHSLPIQDDLMLKLTFSNKYVPFEDVIITSKEANKWEYRPVDNTDNRLTAKFDWNYNDPNNVILDVKTIFNLEIEHPEANLVLTKSSVSSPDT